MLFVTAGALGAACGSSPPPLPPSAPVSDRSPALLCEPVPKRGDVGGELDQTVIEAVRTWRYEPVAIEGKPINAFYVIQVKIVQQ